MSTLKTHNLQSSDSGSVNIALAPNAGMVVAGISTFNNKVLLGTDTEGVANASKFTIADTGHCGMTVRSGTSHDGQIAFSDGTSGDDEYRGQIRYNHADNYLSLVTNATEKLRIDSSGQVSIGGNSSVGTKVHVENSSGDAHIRLRGSANCGVLYTRHSDGGLIGYTGSGNAVNLGSSNLGISASLSGGNIIFQTGGTASSNERFRIADAASTFQNKLIIDDGTNGHLFLNNTSSENAINSGTTGFAAYKNLVINAGQHIFKVSNTERFRIAAGGMITLGNPSNTTLKAEINNSVGGHYFVSQCNDNSNGFEIYQQHGATHTRAPFAVYDNKTGSKDLSFKIDGAGWTYHNTTYNGTTNGSVDKRYNWGSTNNLNFGMQCTTRQRYSIWEHRQIGRTNERTAQMSCGENPSNQGIVYIYSSTANADVTGGVNLANGATSWSGNSDMRLKNKTGDILNALEDINKIEPIRFTWKYGPDNNPHVGVSAQSVENVVPEAIERAVDVERKREGDETEYMQVRYTELIPLSIAAIKELKSEIESLKAEIASLKSS